MNKWHLLTRSQKRHIMNISLFAFFLAVGALVLMASSLIMIFSRLERRQKEKRRGFFRVS